MRFWILKALVLATLVVAAFQLKAQDLSSITGTVTDATGAVIPGIEVTLTNPGTGTSYKAVTTSLGAYTIQNVPPGPGYRIGFEGPGFKPVVVNDLYLNVSATRTQNVKLVVGATAQTVEVSAATQNVTVDTTDATIGNNFEVEMVNDLPIQIRDTPSALFTMQPGVSEDSNGEHSVTGARTDQSHVTLDGLDVDDRATGEFGIVTGNAPVDSVQEFRGVTAGQTANFDSGGGGQFQLVTKSGTNRFHGSLFEYHRDTDLEANDWFNNNAGVGRAPLIRNQFGGNVGGPIHKDKAFFFFEYNGRRDNQGASVLQTVPTPSYLAGNISYVNNSSGNSCSPNSTVLSAPSCISAVSAANVQANFDPLGIGQDGALAQFMAGRYPAGNDPTGGDGINTEGFRFNAPVILKENDYVARIDYNLTDTQKIFARASLVSQRQGDNINYSAPIQFPGDPTTRSIDDASWAWVVGHNWEIGTNKANQVSYGETISRLNFPALYNPTGALQWSFSSPSGPLTNPYLGNYNAQGRVDPVPQLRDDFSWQKHNHTLAFGGTFKFLTPFGNLYLNDFTPSLGIGGALPQLDPSLRPADILNSSSSNPTNNWDTALTFDLGRFSSLGATYNYNADGSIQTMGAGTTRKYRNYETELYFGDTWKVTPSFTVSYGVRYQFYSVPFEVHGVESVQVNASTGKPLGFDEYFQDRLQQSSAGTSGNSSIPLVEYVLGGKANHSSVGGYYKPSYKDFAPRVAFAWNPSSDRRMVINGGAGIVYDHTIVGAVQNFQDHSSYLFQATNNNEYGNGSDPEGSLASDPRFTGINQIPTPPTAPAFSTKTIPYVDNTGAPYGLGINTFNTAIDPNLNTPYSITMDFGIQRDLGAGFLMKLSYAGRLGRRLMAQVDASQVLDFPDPASGERFAQAFANLENEIRSGADPTAVPAEPWFENQVIPGLGVNNGYGNNTQFVASALSNYIFNGDIGDSSQALGGGLTGGAFSLLNPNVVMASQFSSNDFYTNKGFSAYHGLLATLHKNAGHGLQFDFNYTWSHSIDNFSLIANGQSNFTGEFICDATRPRECRGNSDFDITQVFNGNFIYDLPFGRGRTFGAAMPFWMNELVGGWQISGLPTWQTGIPYYANTTAYGAGYATLAPAILVGPSALVTGDPHKDSATGVVNVFKDATAASGAFTGPVGLTLGQRNELRGPHFANLDLGVGKTFPLFLESVKLVFRADAFNSLNHPNFSLPSSSDLNVYSGNFGRITSTVNSARVLQGALRLEF
jgi:carboxypeptidase family protein